MFRGSNGVWRAYYYVNGHQQRVSLRTTDEEQAAARRDMLHRDLLAKGARWHERQKPSAKVSVNRDLYIHERDPFLVRYRKTVIGTAKTLKRAREIRDEYLANHMG